jgi:uncharacterized protein (TIGR02145 family)
MKKLYVLLASLLVSAISFAQAPASISYQAVVRDGNSALVVNQALGMQISVLSGSAQGTVVYKERQEPITNVNGLVTLEVGTGSTGDDFATIDWSPGVNFIKIETDLTGGSNYSITVTSQLLSVPYALQSKKADNGISSDQAADITANKAKLGKAAGKAVGDMQYWDGTSWVVIAKTRNEAARLQMIGGVPNWAGGAPPSITIGAQMWTDRNLDLGAYRDGTIIPQVKDAVEWSSLKTGAWCHYDNNVANDSIYGKLYNWYAVMGITKAESSTPTAAEIAARKQLAPIGFHIPTDGEWKILTSFLGEQAPNGNVGGKMKEATTTYWKSPNTGATNSTAFTGLPAGYRVPDKFSYTGTACFWWSSTQLDSSYVWYLSLNNTNGSAYRSYMNKAAGFSVRCLRD